MADKAGDDWPERARVACVALVAESREGSPSLGVRLLKDLREIFKGNDQLPTRKIISLLCKDEEGPWHSLHGKPLDARKLANMLKPYNINSRDMRIDNRTVKGYLRADLADVWRRYLPSDLPRHPRQDTEINEKRSDD